MSTLIEVSNFSKQYPNHLVKLDDLKITKRVNLLVGKNGSGKSTLLKAIAKLISYDGEIISNKKVCFMSEIVSYPLDLKLSTFLLFLNKISNAQVEMKKREELLKSFNLLGKQNEVLHNLSKGMKAKVNIVQCLSEEADIYLLDEPLSGLDKDAVKCLINYIKQSSKIFVISTHLNSDFKTVSDEVFNI